MNDLPEGAYPFTTIDPSVGEAYVRADCAAPEFGEACTPSVGYCDDGTRFVPRQLVDVAGLIPGAHEGDGLGNQFLRDLNEADVLVHVVDFSGKTDSGGEPTEGHDTFEVVGDVDDDRAAGLERIESLLGTYGGTGVRASLEAALFDALNLIAVFPGSDDGSASETGAFRDCFLLPEGSTTADFADHIHTDLGDGLLHGIDCRSSRQIGGGHELDDRDVIELVTTT